MLKRWNKRHNPYILLVYNLLIIIIIISFFFLIYFIFAYFIFFIIFFSLSLRKSLIDNDTWTLRGILQRYTRTTRLLIDCLRVYSQMRRLSGKSWQRRRVYQPRAHDTRHRRRLQIGDLRYNRRIRQPRPAAKCTTKRRRGILRETPRQWLFVQVWFGLP